MMIVRAHDDRSLLCDEIHIRMSMSKERIPELNEIFVVI